MTTWIPAHKYSAPVSHTLADVLAHFEDMTAAGRTRTQAGGIERGLVIEAMVRQVSAAGLEPVTSGRMDFAHPRDGVALRVEAGRAHQNNDALLSVLEAAKDERVDALVLVVPETYKSSKAIAERVVDQIRWLFAGSGVHLDLAGVAVVAY